MKNPFFNNLENSEGFIFLSSTRRKYLPYWSPFWNQNIRYDFQDQVKCCNGYQLAKLLQHLAGSRKF